MVKLLALNFEELLCKWETVVCDLGFCLLCFSEMYCQAEELQFQPFEHILWGYNHKDIVIFDNSFIIIAFDSI